MIVLTVVLLTLSVFVVVFIAARASKVSMRGRYGLVRISGRVGRAKMVSFISGLSVGNDSGVIRSGLVKMSGRVGLPNGRSPPV